MLMPYPSTFFSSPGPVRMARAFVILKGDAAMMPMSLVIVLFCVLSWVATVCSLQVYPQYSFSLGTDDEVEEFRRHWELFGSAKITTVAQSEEDRKQYEEQATKSGTIRAIGISLLY